jgi:hypothetical protein
LAESFLMARTLDNAAPDKFQRDVNHARTVEVGVFDSVSSAKSAVDRLLQCGFTVEEITVVCSDETKERWFKEFDHQQPAGTHTAKASLVGGAVGATIGTLAVLGSAVATGSIALWAAGPIFAWTGGVAGGLVGAMMTRGVEKELANYYQQAVIEGDILVAVDETASADAKKLASAAHVFADCGAKPLSLSEG